MTGGREPLASYLFEIASKSEGLESALLEIHGTAHPGADLDSFAAGFAERTILFARSSSRAKLTPLAETSTVMKLESRRPPSLHGWASDQLRIAISEVPAALPHGIKRIEANVDKRALTLDGMRVQLNNDRFGVHVTSYFDHQNHHICDCQTGVDAVGIVAARIAHPGRIAGIIGTADLMTKLAMVGREHVDETVSNELFALGAAGILVPPLSGGTAPIRPGPRLDEALGLISEDLLEAAETLVRTIDVPHITALEQHFYSDEERRNPENAPVTAHERLEAAVTAEAALPAAIALREAANRADAARRDPLLVEIVAELRRK